MMIKLQNIELQLQTLPHLTVVTQAKIHNFVKSVII